METTKIDLKNVADTLHKNFVDSNDLLLDFEHEKEQEFAHWIHNNWFVPKKDGSGNWRMKIEHIEFVQTVPFLNVDDIPTDALINAYKKGYGEL